MVLGVSILSSEAAFAAPVAKFSPMHAMFSQDKMVKFNLHNATDAPIKVKAGEVDVTLPPGKDMPMKLPVGAKIVVEEATAQFPQGTVLTVVSSDLSDSTVKLN